MAVAEKSSKEKSTPGGNPTAKLAFAGIKGSLFVLFSLAMLFVGIPYIWEIIFHPFVDGAGNRLHPLNLIREGTQLDILDPFQSTCLLLFCLIGAFVGFVFVGSKLEGKHPLRGARAGAFIFAAYFLITLLLSLGIGSWIANRGEGNEILGLIVTVAIAIGLLFVFSRFAFSPGFGKNLVSLEEQGWFHPSAFKFNQGVRVRRGTLVSLLVVIGCGIYTAVMTRSFGTGNWTMSIPGTDYYLFILYNVQYTVPLFLLALLGWFTWRVVNWPTFADFLIATEAELNKVSWTTRKRLFQDTIVVLVTVFLMTMFLFIVDILWIKLLSLPVPGVLQIDPKEAIARQTAPKEW